MNRRPTRKIGWKGQSVAGLLLLALVASLSGCAAERLAAEGRDLIAAGKKNEGVQKLAKAASEKGALRPEALRQRDAALNGFLQAGGTALGEYKLEEAKANLRLAEELSRVDSRVVFLAAAIDRFALHSNLLDEAFSREKVGDVEEADRLVLRVLRDNPTHSGALGFKRKLDMKMASKFEGRPQLQLTSNRPLTIDFKDAPLKSVFAALSASTGINFLFDKDLRTESRVTVVLKDASLEQILDLILLTSQLEKRVLTNNTVLVFQVGGQRQRELQDLILRAFYLNSADAKIVATNLRTLLKIKDVVVDERLNAVYLREPAEVMQIAERFIAVQDVTEPEVMLEVEVLEINRSKLLDMGIQYPSQITFTALSGQGSTGAMTITDALSLNSGRIQAAFGPAGINATSSKGMVNLLANPRIRARGREKAKIHIGDRVPVITTTTSQGVVAENAQYLEVGIKLEVEPTIHPQNEIGMKLSLEVSSIAREIRTPSGALVYQIGTRSAATSIRLRDGETQILGGLINDEERGSMVGLPFLSDLPLIGRLFGSRSDTGTKTEILLAITPRVIRGIDRPSIGADRFWTGTENMPRSRQIAEGPVSVLASLPSGLSADGSPKGALMAASQLAPAPSLALPSGGSMVVGMLQLPAAIPPASRIDMSWRVEQQPKAGERFSFWLDAKATGAVGLVPMRLKFDPSEMEILGIVGGEFFKVVETQSPGLLSQTVDPVTGIINLNVGRTGPPKAVSQGALFQVVGRLKPGKTKASVSVLEMRASNEGREISVVTPGSLDLLEGK